MSGDNDRLLYWPKFFLDHISTSFVSWLGLFNSESLRAQSPLSGAGSHFGILSPTVSNRPGSWLYYFLRPPASAVLPLIYTGASLDWRLGRGSIYNTFFNHPIFCYLLSFVSYTGIRLLIKTAQNDHPSKYWQHPSLFNFDNLTGTVA